MIDFYNGGIADIMPGNLTREPAVQALSYAVREGTRLLYRYAQRSRVYCSIETMPDEILNLLAQELRTQYYKDDLDIDTKRALVRNTLIWYMTAGTPAAVEELVAIVFGEGRVVEWFEYGARPYWFKIQTDALLTYDKIMYFPRMLWKVKNTRSHIHMIEVHRSMDKFQFYAGCGRYAVYKPEAVIDGFTVSRIRRNIVYVGAVQTKTVKPAPVIDGFAAERSMVKIMHIGVAQAECVRQVPVKEG